MANLYLSLQDHAADQIVEGYAAFAKLDEAAPSMRTPQALAQVVISLHLAIDKTVKAGLGHIDPALLIKSMSGDTIQRLHKERLRQGLPSILAVPGKEETHHLLGLLHIGKAFFVPPLEERDYDEFLGHVQDLVDLRNQIVHKEFVGDYDHVATILLQILSRLPMVVEAIAPGVIASAYQQNDQLQSRLRALALEVDAAWQVLFDFLGEGNEITLPITMWITIPPESTVAEIILGGGTFTTNGILASDEILRSEDDQLLLREMPIPPPPLGLLGTPGSPADPPTRAGLNALGRLFVGARTTHEERSVVPRQSGTLKLQNVAARLALKLAGRRRSSLGVNVAIHEFDMSFDHGVRQGMCTAKLGPAGTSLGENVSSIQLHGAALIETEFAVSETSEHFVRGTTLRKIGIDAKLVR